MDQKTFTSREDAHQHCKVLCGWQHLHPHAGRLYLPNSEGEYADRWVIRFRGDLFLRTDGTVR